ncbi:uncharacterized protein LOC127243445 [Andrographis paniculata]|uniref:uncharacterized protein LOC127243445 n=1 Tax=Andrographis paniculata TaxID=175694 RepID=UPI0021E77F9B|nr:uncharacterized protein LOC127243445 [Andrographis paniculata]
MEADPWEALDLDDSDLPSLLRPCKQLRSASAPAPGPSPSALPEENRRQQQLQPSTSCRRAIPGPAGAIQAAMLRKNLDRANKAFSNTRDDCAQDFDGVTSTQDYIRRAVEDTAEFDDDFTRHPWISALQFLGAENGVVPCTPISSMKECLNVGRIAQVVAVIKSCTPNGLGGLIVSLKDPTGTIGASIHHKVLSGSEFGKNLSTGAVLILQEVTLFSPVRSAHYLNVTQRNLVKVFCHNNGSTSKLNNTAFPLRYADPGIEYCVKGQRSSKIGHKESAGMGDIEQRHSTGEAENVHNRSVVNKQNLLNRSIQPHAVTNDTTAGRRGSINLRKETSNVIPEDMIGTRNAANHPESANLSLKEAKGGGLECPVMDNTNNTSNSVPRHSCEEIQVNEAQRQPVILKSSLPQWTDEQLDQLFDEDESSSLF